MTIKVIVERKLSKKEKKNREKLAKKYKPAMKSFKDQYGDEGESVYYATMTKKAKEGETVKESDETEEIEEAKSHHPKPGRNKKYFGGSFYDFGLAHGDSGADVGGDGGGDGNRDEEQLDEKKKRKKKKKKKKKGKKDACYHKVRARYDVWPSAYASGALVKCRKVGAANWGNKYKKTNEDMIADIENLLEQADEIIEEAMNIDEKKKSKSKKKGSKLTSKPSSEKSLHHWFSRKGAKGKKKGWVDCNAPDGKGGYKSCGRSGDEKRKKYPACRPTPGACKKMKGSKGKSWGKKGSKKK